MELWCWSIGKYHSAYSQYEQRILIRVYADQFWEPGKIPIILHHHQTKNLVLFFYDSTQSDQDLKASILVKHTRLDFLA
jgi:hypothetical protein